MDYSNQRTIIFLGHSGSGKSAVCNYFHQKLAEPQDQKSPFKESSYAKSTKMKNPVVLSYENIKIVDTPGLSDSGGSQQDIENLRKICEFTKELKFVNSFTIVLNEQNIRFDESTQATFCLLYTYFGSQFLQHVNFIFTRANRLKFGKVQTQEKVQKFIEILSQRLGKSIPIQNLSQLKCFQLECHPDDYEGYSDDYKQQLSKRTEDEFKSFLLSVTEIEPLDTTQTYSNEELKKKVQEAVENLSKIEDKSKQIEEQLYRVEAVRQELQLQKFDKIQAEKQILEVQEKLRNQSNQGIVQASCDFAATNRLISQCQGVVAIYQDKNREGQIEQNQSEIKELQQQSQLVKEEIKKQKNFISTWWWLLALDFNEKAAVSDEPVRLCIAEASTTSTYTAISAIFIAGLTSLWFFKK